MRFGRTWESGRCPFPSPEWKSNIRVARLALEKLLSSATSEKACGGRRSSPFLPRPRSSSREQGDRRGKGGGRGYSSPPPRCQSHFVSRHAFRPFTPPRIQCDRWNANKKHHTKVATTLSHSLTLSFSLSLSRGQRASRRVVAPFRQNFLSKFDDRPVCQYSTSTLPANRYANNFSSPRSL